MLRLAHVLAGLVLQDGDVGFAAQLLGAVE